MNPNYSNFTLFLIIKNWKILLFSITAVILASFFLPEAISFDILALAELVTLLFLATNYRKLFNTDSINNESKIYFTVFFLLDIIFLFILKYLKITSFFGVLSFLINYYLILSYYPMIIRQLSLQDNLTQINNLKSKQFKIVFIAYAVPQLIGSLVSPVSFYFYSTTFIPDYLLLSLSFILKILTYILSISLLSIEHDSEQVNQICKDNNFSINFPYFRLQNAFFAGVLAISLSLILYTNPQKLPDGFKTESKMKCSDGQIEIEIKYKNPNNAFFSPIAFYLAGEKPEDKLNATLFDMKNTENILLVKYKVERNKTELRYLDNLNLWYSDKKLEKVKCLD